MRVCELKLSGVNSNIYCGEGAFESTAHGCADGKKVFIVTDFNVFSLYGERIKRVWGGAPVKVIPAGESSKNKNVLFSILSEMLARGMGRDCCVIAFGGGVVGDVAGLAASLYMRGVRLVQIPTTLLAQVDSSVGGKTAIDFAGVKNAVGAFYQPAVVIADPLFLKTLPAREIRCGLGEIIKYGALDEKIYNKLLKNIRNLKDTKFLEDIIYDCIAHKAMVVTADERDLTGVRQTLNLGHTTGHAFELYYRRKSHGEFVLIGAYYELLIAENLGICGGQYAENLKKLIRAVIKKIPVYGNLREACKLALHDKKNTGGLITLVVPCSEGKTQALSLKYEEYASAVERAAQIIGGEQ